MEETGIKYNIRQCDPSLKLVTIEDGLDVYVFRVSMSQFRVSLTEHDNNGNVYHVSEIKGTVYYEEIREWLLLG